MKHRIRKGIAAAAIVLSGFGLAGGLAAHFNHNSAPPAASQSNSAQQSASIVAPPAVSAATASLPQSAPVGRCPAGPRIDGPATPPKMEGQNTRDQDDLDVSIPGTGIAIGGDGAHGYPQIRIPGVYEGGNPLPVPYDTRPLPTGTALGPNGEHYAFYAIVPYHLPNGAFNTTIFTSPDTVVVDLANPRVPLFTLKGISQASGAYDAQSGRMIIMGNTLNGDRALWQSDPVCQNSNWGNTLQPLGKFSGAMNGDRESQIVALPKGGLMAVGVGNYTPILAVTAPTAQGLLTATPQTLVTWKMLPGAYGPTITDIQEVNGKLVIGLRVSTFGGNIYSPHTYKSTFTVTPPAQTAQQLAQQVSVPLPGPAVIPKLTGFGSS